MGQIRGYEAPQGLSINPTEIGVDATAQAARRIGTFYNQAGDAISDVGNRVGSTIRDAGQVAVDYMDHQQISTGSANGAEVLDNLIKSKDQVIKGIDPNDPAYGQKVATALQQWRENNLGPALEKFQEGFTTEKSQAWAEHFVESTRNHMFVSSAADMSSAARIGVTTSIEKTVNSLSSAAANDPSSLQFALKTVDSSIRGVVGANPSLSASDSQSLIAETGFKAKEQIVKSAVASMITKNPNIDLGAIQQKYGEYIKGDEMKMFQKAAQTQAKVDMLQQKQLQTYQRQQQEHAAGDALTKVMTDNMSADANGKMTINPAALQQSLDIARKYPEAGAAHAEAMIKFIQSQQERSNEVKVVDNPGVVKDLSDRLFDPDKPLTAVDLMRASTKGDISDHTYTKLNGMLKELEQTPLKGPIYQDTMKAVHSQLVLNIPNIPGKDDVGTKNYALFVQNFIPQYLAKSRNGTLEPNALDVNDPESMISKSMAPFKRTPAQRMQDYVSGIKELGNQIPGALPPQTEPANIPTVTTKEAFYALPKGAVYIGKDGQRYRKP